MAIVLAAPILLIEWLVILQVKDTERLIGMAWTMGLYWLYLSAMALWKKISVGSILGTFLFLFLGTLGKQIYINGAWNIKDALEGIPVMSLIVTLMIIWPLIVFFIGKHFYPALAKRIREPSNKSE